MVDYELINEINDNDRKEMEEYRIEEEEEKEPTFVEGCYLDCALGIYIPYNIILIAIDYGFKPSEEFTKLQNEAQLKEEDEEEFITHNYEWIYEEMENAESYMNDKFAKAGYYFGIFPDWGDWGYYKFENEDQEMEE
jgi:hypothetical protein